MWSAIFGAEQALHDRPEAEEEETAVSSPVMTTRHASPPPSSSSSSSSKLPPPVSPADTASSTPRSSFGDLSSSSSRPSLPKRPSVLADDDTEDAEDASALAMVLRRMNALMVRVGEHEFEKKMLVDQMDKDRDRLNAQILALNRHIQELNDQNTQLQYKIEYNSEPMLRERLQDATDMRDAMTAVKMQLENDVQDKQKQIDALLDQLLQHDEAMMQLQAQVEELKQQQEEQHAELDQARQTAETEAQRKCEALAEQLHAVTMDRDSLVTARDETKQQLETVTQDKIQEVMELAAELQHAQQANEQRVAELEQAHQQQVSEMEQTHATRLAEWKQSSDQRLAEKEQQLLQLKSELTEQGHEAESRVSERVTELETQLEQQAQETESRMNEMNQVMEDYKHDCMELWKLNEDLKQQLALASADAMVKEAEFRQQEFSMQSRVSELESQVEELQESITRKEQELVMKEEELISAKEDTVAAVQRLQEEAENHQPWQENAIRVLTEQVSTAQRELSEAMELNLHLNNRNTWLEEQSYQLIAETDAAKASASMWEQQLYTAQQQLELEQRTVADRHASIQRLEQQVQDSAREMDAFRQRGEREKTHLYKLVEEANQRVTELQTQLACTESEAETAAAAALATTNARVQELEMELQRLATEKDSLADEVDQLKMTVAATPAVDESVVKQKELEVGGLRKSLETLGKDFDALSASWDEQARSIEHLQHEIAQYQSQIKSLKEARLAEASSSADTTSLEQEVETLRESNRKLGDEREVLQSALVKACQEVDAFKHKAEQTTLLMAEKETLQEDLELAQSTLAEAEAEIAAKAQWIQTLEQQMSELQASAQLDASADSQLENAKQEIARLSSDLQQKTTAIAQLEQSLHEAQANVGDATQRVQNELNAARDLAASLQYELDHLKVTEHALRLQLQDAGSVSQQQLEFVHSERKALEQQLLVVQQLSDDATAQLEAERAAAHHELTTALAAKRELQDQVDDLSKTLDQERARLLALETQATGAQQEQIASLQHQVEALSRKNQSLIAEVSVAREEWESTDAHAASQLQHLQATLTETKMENAKLTEAFQAKDAEFQTLRDSNMAEILKMRSSLEQLTHEKSSVDAQVQQLRAEAVQWREATEKANADRAKLVAEMEMQVQEVNRLQTQLKNAEAALGSGQQAAEQARVLQEEKNRVVDELRQLEIATSKSEEHTRELEQALEEAKHMCEEREAKIDELQELLQQTQEERAAESAHLAILNGSLRHEIEQLAESRYEQERYIEELRLQQADLQAEKNVLAARAYRLTQELSQYTELPEEDAIADAHAQAPDLWELLSSGMEQLKADLELASKYASSIEGTGVLESDDNSPEHDKSLAIAS